MGIEFRPLTDDERAKLSRSLGDNAEHGQPIKMDARDTTFLGTQEADESIESLIATIRSVPCHYAEFTLPRNGQPPLKFSGELVAESDGERQTGREQNRWHELAVYQLDGGRYVVAITYRTRWQGELDHASAEVATSPAAAADILRRYDPCGAVKGFPPGDAYRDRQEALFADIRRRYDAQVSEVLADDAFAESV